MDLQAPPTWLAASFVGLGLCLALLVWALLRALRRRWALRAARNVRAMSRISWPAFEQLVAELFRRRGYSATVTPPGKDGGVDVIVESRSERAIVQAKHWPHRTVGVAVVRELYALLDDFDADRGFVATSGRISPEARLFAEHKPIELLDGPAIVAAARRLRTHAPTSDAEPEALAEQSASRCPHCGAPIESPGG